MSSKYPKLRRATFSYARRRELMVVELTDKEKILRPLMNWNSSKSMKNVWNLRRSNNYHWIQPKKSGPLKVFTSRRQ
jgi:hypothetical protein